MNFTFTTEAGGIDLVDEVSGLGFYAAVKKHAEELEVLGLRLWVLTLPALIRSKKAAGREKDLRLIPELEALQALRGEGEEQH